MSFIIVDFGSQYTHLITKMLNYKLGVSSVLIPYTYVDETQLLDNVKGVILSGGPKNVNDIKDVEAYLTCLGYKNFMFEEEKDYAAVLGITKYEPPTAAVFTGTKITSTRRLAEHPQFHSYNGIDNIKWGDPFAWDEEVVIQRSFGLGIGNRGAILHGIHIILACDFQERREHVAGLVGET